MAKLPFAGQLQFAQYIGLLVGNRLVFGVERYLSLPSIWSRTARSAGDSTSSIRLHMSKACGVIPEYVVRMVGMSMEN